MWKPANGFSISTREIHIVLFAIHKKMWFDGYKDDIKDPAKLFSLCHSFVKHLDSHTDEKLLMAGVIVQFNKIFK